MTAQVTGSGQSRLAHFPITLFATGMGMMGFTLALRAAETAFALPHGVSITALWVSVVALAIVILGYAAKALRYPQAVLAEWHHPVKIAFFPAASVALILLATALMDVAPVAAKPIWMVATALQGGLALSVISAWIGHRAFQPTTLSPAWFIPAVGNILVPLAGVRLGYVEISWLFFSAGVIFWLVLLTLVMNRLMFHDPLPERLAPTLVILIAPPAAGYAAWVWLAGEPGAFGHFLVNVGYVFALLVAMQVGKFRTIPFSLSWWALSFPLAALAIASFGYAHAAGSEAHRIIGVGVLALLTLVIAWLIVRTVQAIKKGEICVPD